jgi:hypothetical protein
LLPAVQAAREAARRSQCSNNLKQLGLSIHNYHDTYKVMPFRQGGTAGGGSNGERISGYVPLLPFFEQEPLYEQIAGGAGGAYNPFGPVPWDGGFPPWEAKLGGLLCPSDGVSGDFNPSDVQPANYVFSVGDYTSWAHDETSRGPFTYRRTYPFAKVKDGLSNTIAMSERCIGRGRAQMILGGTVVNRSSAVPSNPANNNPVDCLATVGPNGMYIGGLDYRDWASQRWPDGATAFRVMNTILPPNGPTCNEGAWDGNRILAPPTSYHPGGVNALVCDGAVRFISETVDTGNLASGSVTQGPSPYGVWGALGSKDGGESVPMP